MRNNKHVVIVIGSVVFGLAVGVGALALATSFLPGVREEKGQRVVLAGLGVDKLAAQLAAGSQCTEARAGDYVTKQKCFIPSTAAESDTVDKFASIAEAVGWVRSQNVPHYEGELVRYSRTVRESDRPFSAMVSVVRSGAGGYDLDVTVG